MGQMTEEQRAAASKKMAEYLIDGVAAHVVNAGGSAEDAASIMVTAGIGAAVASVATTAVDSAAVVALVTCIAEQMAKDVFGLA